MLDSFNVKFSRLLWFPCRNFDMAQPVPQLLYSIRTRSADFCTGFFKEHLSSLFKELGVLILCPKHVISYPNGKHRRKKE